MDIILNNKIRMLKGLKTQTEAIAGQQSSETPGNPDGESAVFRVKWAIENIDRESRITRELLRDLSQSLNEVSAFSAHQHNAKQSHFSFSKFARLNKMS
jgi:hypothetical protein